MDMPASDNSTAAATFFFDDPRLRMTVGGRMLIRIITYVFYIFLIAAAGTLLMSGVAHFAAAGTLLALFLVDRWMHRKEGDVPIAMLPRTGRVNIARAFGADTFLVIERAFDRSVLTKRNFYLETIERIMEMPNIAEGLRRLDVSPAEFKGKLEDFITKSVPPVAPQEAKKQSDKEARAAILATINTLAVGAFEEAVATGHAFVEVQDLFAALGGIKDGFADRLFNLFAIDPDDLKRALILSSVKGEFRRIPAVLGGFAHALRRGIRHRVMNRAWTSRPTPALDRYGTDFTDLARESQAGFLVGHAEEYEKLVQILARTASPNALLLGEPGAGKGALIQHLAFKLIKDEVPRALFDKRLVSIELQNLVAGATPEELSARMAMVVQEIVTAGNVILYIPDIHNLVKSSSAAYHTAADALMPVVKNDAFPIIGASYPMEYKQLVEARSDFKGTFEVVVVNEISIPEAETVLTYESLILEREYRITVSFGAIKRAVTLAKKYFTDKLLPSSAEELLKSALVSAEERGEKTLGPDLVTAVAEAKVNIPLHEADQGEAEKLIHLEENIHERLVGQDEAVTAVAEALREYRSGLTRQGGPIASFLFVGPTGVGKTELAKILAKIQFGSEKMMVRFDMTEYQDKESFIRFIGSPDGTTSGALTEAVRGKPYSLILLDEFEKAFPDILDLFLQVFDDGRLTDNLGRVIDFTNTIIIATSNAHSDIINEALAKGETMVAIEDYLKTRLTDIFKPELLNRFSKIIVFRNLAPTDLTKIVKLNLDDLTETVKAQGVYLDFDPSAVSEIVKLGYDPAFGARPLRRMIDEKIRAPLASALLGKTITKGDRIKLVYENDTFSFVPVK
jgi:ATP-dependent Clp protease ATP-binding subunit ClpC